jgi:tetratricopeptide (TPR) repeat protein
VRHAVRNSAFSCVVASWIIVSGFSPSQTLASPDVGSLLQTATSQFDAGAFASAVAALKSVLAQNPENVSAHYWLARCYYELRDYDSAVTQAELSVTLDPNNSLYHQWLGRAYGGKADRQRSFLLARKVRQEFEEAVRLNPENIGARQDLQRFYIEAPWVVGGSRDKAREMTEAIASLDETEGHLARASFYQKELKRPDLAEKEYRLVLAAAPKRIEPYLEIAEFYEDRKNGPALIKTLTYAEKVDPADPRIAYYRGAALIAMGSDLKQAERLLLDYLSIPQRSDRPSRAAAHEWLGRLYEQQGKLPAAAEQYRTALEMDRSRRGARAGLDRIKKSMQQ